VGERGTTMRQLAHLGTAINRKRANFSDAIGRTRRRDGAGAAAALAARWIAEGMFRPVSNQRNRRIDYDLGARTLGMTPVTDSMRSAAVNPDSTWYEGVDARQFMKMLRQLPIGSPGDFAFVDLGSGKGRALLLAARYGFRSVLGVELDGGLVELSRHNVRSFEAVSPRHAGVIRVQQGDAANFTPPARPTVLFLYNPFGEATLRTVVDNVDRSLKDSPRPFAVAYYNPLHREVIDGSRLLRRASMTTRWALYEACEPR